MIALTTGAVKRERHTKVRMQVLDAQILAVLREDHPQSIRHVFYRMTNPRLAEPVPKSDKGYKQVQARCTVLRRNGSLPYGWLVDSTRRGYHVDTFSGKADFLHRINGLYRANLWANADHHCEVWTESRSIAGVIQDDCSELAVSLYPCGGFSSITLAYDAAQHINGAVEAQPVTILYVGDYDPAGVLIDVSLERELRQHLRSDVHLDFRRIGITEQQVIELDLPTNTRKATDKRSSHITYTVEAEAMPAKLMRKLVRDSIESLLPPHALEISKLAESEERRGLQLWAKIFRDDDGGEVEHG
jgi:hypothetical protein